MKIETNSSPSQWERLFDEKKYPDEAVETFDPKEYYAALSALNANYDQIPSGIKAARDSDCSVTVIVTNYNSGSYLESSVKSLLFQKNIAPKIIIVDDKSSDISRDVARELVASFENIMLVELPKNFGTYVAKNIGLSLAETRYIAFQDADDISGPHRLELQYRELVSNSETVAVTTQYCRISDKTGRLIRNRGQYCRDGLISLMLDWQKIKHSVGFFDTVRVNADDEFKTRIRTVYGKEAISEIPRCIYYAILKGGALTTTGPTKNDLQSSNIDEFLAPVRKRYTKSFQNWHATAKRDQLYLPFPPNTRKFYTPTSISAVASLKATRVVIVAPSHDQASRQAKEFQRIFTDVDILAAAGDPASIEFRNLSTFAQSSRFEDLQRGHEISGYPGSLLQKEEMIDTLGSDLFIFVSGGAQANVISEIELRMALLFIARFAGESTVCLPLSNGGVVGRLRDAPRPISSSPLKNVTPYAVLYELVAQDRGRIFFLDENGLPVNA